MTSLVGVSVSMAGVSDVGAGVSGTGVSGEPPGIGVEATLLPGDLSIGSLQLADAFSPGEPGDLSVMIG